MAKPVLAFDMDGVLVDVTESYRETIRATVKHFTGAEITRDLIQDYKNQGGWNDDWSLSHEIIRRAGVDVTREAVIDYFQSIFHGDGSNGLILRERWIAREGLFDRLAERYELAVFTGRLRWEAELTLNRFLRADRFSPVIGIDDVENGKPAPDGLIKIQAQYPESRLWYIGDTVDDGRAAMAAGAIFVGIAAPGKPLHMELCVRLGEEGAVAVLDDINQLENVLARAEGAVR